ncbi:NHL repeat-containing protein [Candidatus Sumerlaeota bacterium]|nr:NHL repeat-containing protein [Candidatus Sumerlaeota bacterium]
MRRGLWIIAAVFALTVGEVCAAVPLVGCEPAGVLEPSGDLALVMPSAAMEMADGRWAILDGVSDRIVFTDAEGHGLSSIGESVLSSPLGLTLDDEDLLWVADSGNRRVVALTPEGDLVGDYPRPDDPAFDPVDLAFDRDGSTLLVVDNDGHRVVSLDTETGQWGEVWGEYGEGFDQFNHPFSIDVSATGRRAVVDVLNSRLMIRDPSFDFTFEIRDWGVDAGQLYRPKGVAIDSGGRIFVSDSVLGVVQVFDAGGLLVGVLADGDEVRHLRTPTRLSLGRQGRLAVVEMRANRISLWDVEP